MQSVFSRNQNVSSALFLGDELMLGQGRSGNIISLDVNNLTPTYALTGRGRDFRRLFVKDKKLGFAVDDSRVPDGYFDFELEQIIRDKSQLSGFQGPKVSDGAFDFNKLSSNQLAFGSNFSITNSRTDGRVLSYCLLSNDNIVVGSDRTLKVYDGNGNLLKTLSGHNGQVLSIVADEQYFYTYGGDQIIKVWTISDPTLKFNLFITKQYEWIIWDEMGNYSASSGGEQFLNWQINGKEEELAKFFDVSAYAKLFLKKSLDEVGSTDVRDLAPEDLPDQPQIQWMDPVDYQVTTSDNQYRIRATIFSDEPILKTRILVEGKAMPKKLKSEMTRAIATADLIGARRWVNRLK